MQACLQKLGVTLGGPQTQQQRRRSATASAAAPARRAAAAPTGRAFQQCLPASLRRFRTRFTAPSQTLRRC